VPAGQSCADWARANVSLLYAPRLVAVRVLGGESPDGAATRMSTLLLRWRWFRRQGRRPRAQRQCESAAPRRRELLLSLLVNRSSRSSSVCVVSTANACFIGCACLADAQRANTKRSRVRAGQCKQIKCDLEMSIAQCNFSFVLPAVFLNHGTVLGTIRAHA
jgi:hypothetical protein